MMSPKGVRFSSMWATARAMTASISETSVGKYAHGICMRSKSPGVICPMSSCWGSSWGPPGSPRRVVITSDGTLKIMLSEVSGFTVFPKPEFWNITMDRTPPRSAPAAMATIEAAEGIVQTLAGLDRVEPMSGSRPAGALALAHEGEELWLANVVDTVDAGAERERLSKLIAERERAIAGFEAKLGNEGYLAKAPPAVVDDTRAKCAQAKSDLDAARSALAALGVEA